MMLGLTDAIQHFSMSEQASDTPDPMAPTEATPAPQSPAGRRSACAPSSGPPQQRQQPEPGWWSRWPSQQRRPRRPSAPGARPVGRVVPRPVWRDPAAAQARHLPGPARRPARSAGQRWPEGRLGAAHPLQPLPDGRGLRAAAPRPGRPTRRSPRARACAPRPDRSVPPARCAQPRRPAPQDAPAHRRGLRGLRPVARRLPGARVAARTRKSTRSPPTPWKPRPAGIARDEALLRTFEASGKNLNEFADMYGLHVLDANRTLERAKARRDQSTARPDARRGLARHQAAGMVNTVSTPV